MIVVAFLKPLINKTPLYATPIIIVYI